MDILVACRKCGTENTVTIAKGDNASYILSNRGMKEVLKIGLSTRPVQERIAELSSASGVPTRFELEAFFVSNDPEADEQEIHSALAVYRVKGKEFFDVTVSKALRVVESICKRQTFSY